MASALAPVALNTDRLEIRPFEEGDMSPRYLAWLNDRITVRYSQQGLQEQDLKSCRTYRDEILTSGGAMLAICIQAAPLNAHIGNMTLRPFGQSNDQVDISILIGERSELGRGYATEAWLAICHYLFNSHGTKRVTAGTHQDNTKMLALMARTGMRPFEPTDNASRENIYMVLDPEHAVGQSYSQHHRDKNQ